MGSVNHRYHQWSEKTWRGSDWLVVALKNYLVDVHVEWNIDSLITSKDMNELVVGQCYLLQLRVLSPPDTPTFCNLKGIKVSTLTMTGIWGNAKAILVLKESYRYIETDVVC